MSKSTSLTSRNKTWTRLVNWLERLLEAAGQRAFSDDDMRARHHGWQITSRYRGLARSYRDPRFDTLTSCPRCHGTGFLESDPCPRCESAGRLSQPAGPGPKGGEVRDQDSFPAAQ